MTYSAGRAGEDLGAPANWPLAALLGTLCANTAHGGAVRLASRQLAGALNDEDDL
jgi:hypothetical protein